MRPYYDHAGIQIFHGDCRAVLIDMVDTADLVLTDPPYGVEWQSNRRKEKHDTIHNDDGTEWAHEAFRRIHAALKNDRLAVSFYGWPRADVFVQAWRAAGFDFKSHLVWLKNNMGLGWFTRGQHEVAYLLAKGEPARPVTPASDVFRADGTGNYFHPTQKPEELMTAMIRAFTMAPRPAVILDPFMGAGTTLRAAKDLGHRAVGIEIDERYCEIAARRMEQEVLPMFDPPPAAAALTELFTESTGPGDNS